MKSSELIQEMRLITQDNISIIKEKFIYLNSEQRKWKIDKVTWDLNQIFMHLNDYATYYHSTIISKINKTKFKDTKEIFISSPLGRAAWKSMKLGNLKNIKRKIKSPKQYNPSFNNKAYNSKALEEFIEKQEEMLKIIDLAASVNLKKVKIPISISKIVRLRLGDALLFVNYHNQRHIQQAINLVSHSNFPKI
jgi:hypothetical protein